jgi:hypothetical protein
MFERAKRGSFTMPRIVGSADFLINAYNPATQFTAREQLILIYWE